MQLADHDAAELVGMIRSGQLSPVELLDACIGRIEALNPRLNAVVAECFDRARAEAATVAARLKASEPSSPLLGIPLLVKDLTPTAGLVTTFGCPAYRDHVPEHDAPVVAAARQAGAIVIGKTNTPEFGIGGVTRNRLHGVTRNPYDPGLTCGGSSGGSAVAVATGMAPLATGTDSGGSLRNPAAFCGVVGLRSTPGLLPSPGRKQAWSPMGVVGPMARSVEDAALLLSAMIRAERPDPMSFPVDRQAFDAITPADPAHARVVFSPDLGFAPVSSSIRRTFDAKIAKLAPAFRECSLIEPRLDNAEAVSWILRCLYLLSTHRARYAGERDMLEPKLLGNLEVAKRQTATEIAWAHAEQAVLCEKFSGLFDRADVIVTPAASVSPFSAELDFPGAIDGIELAHYAEWMAITYAVTLVGHPALVVPCGLDEQGLPFGLQLIGRRYRDLDLLRFGLGLERHVAGDPEIGRVPAPNLPGSGVVAARQG